MKITLTFFPILFWISVIGQFRIVDGSEFEIATPENVKSYKIYCHSTSLGWKESFKGKRILTKTVFINKGLERKIIKSQGNKVSLVQFNYFKDSLRLQSVVKYKHPKSLEKFYYKYDTTSNNPIDVKGYKDGKLIYAESQYYVKDTLINNKDYDMVNFITAKEKTVTYYAQDSLTKTTIHYQSNSPDTNYLFIKYDQELKIIQEVDSSSDSYSRTTYQYDTMGRLIFEDKITNETYDRAISWTYTYDSLGRKKDEIRIDDSAETFLIKHYYSLHETKKVEHIMLPNGEPDTIRMVTKQFDHEGNLIYEEEKEFDDNGKKPGEPEDVTISFQSWIYEKGRIVKYTRHRGNDSPIFTYDVTYRE
jgi:YD repeat-containing protein